MSRLMVFLLLAVLGLKATPAYAGGGRDFLGGRGFLGGVAFGVGVSLGRSLFYSPPRYYVQPNYVVYQNPSPIYYVPPSTPQNVTVVATPPPAAPVTQPTSVPVSTRGRLSKILYDADAKPVGVLVLNNDGSQEFIPLVK